MAKETKHQREGKKKAALSLKEKRARKHEKKQQKTEHLLDKPIVEDYQ